MSVRLETVEGGYPTYRMEHPIKQWKFPCGEVGVKIENALAFGTFLAGKDVVITLDWEDNSDLMLLAQLVDACRQAKIERISLDIPYFPYSRQDRRCHPGEGHGLKMVGQFINSLGFHEVRTLDAHSTVLEAVVDRLHVVPQSLCAYGLPEFDVLVAPDAGAAKKVYQHAQVLHGTRVMEAGKTRGADGKIIGINVPNPAQLQGKKVCVVDDLCDGGATFLGLGEVLRDGNPSELSLYVTHGFFTKGLDALLGIYDNIYVSNLMRHEYRGRVKEI